MWRKCDIKVQCSHRNGKNCFRWALLSSNKKYFVLLSTVSIKYSYIESVCVCVCVLLPWFPGKIIAFFTTYIVISGVSRSAISFHIISYTLHFSKKMLRIEYILIFPTTFAGTFLRLRIIQRSDSLSWIYLELHGKYPLFLSRFNQTSVFFFYF